MTGIDCRGGHTQIGKVLTHARRETAKRKVAVMVFVGDALEEPIDTLAAKAGELALLGLRVFLFQEGRDPEVERGFREIARLTSPRTGQAKLTYLRDAVAVTRAVVLHAGDGDGALRCTGGQLA